MTQPASVEDCCTQTQTLTLAQPESPHVIDRQREKSGKNAGRLLEGLQQAAEDIAQRVGSAVENSDQAGSFLDIDCAIALPLPFELDHAVITEPVTVKARLTGPEHAPVILVLGGISANRHISDAPTGEPGWWREMTDPGQALDPHRFRLLSFDFIPGNEDAVLQDSRVTPRDQARVAALVCDHFGIDRLAAFVGASYGGMVALAFGALYPERAGRLIVACAAHRPHPMGTAWRSIQRKMVRFGLETGKPEQALALARELGMTTYRTANEFSQRFSAEKNGDNRFEVEEYLETRGQAFIGRMSPERYLSLSESIDLHNVNPADVQVPVTLIAFKEDQLVPVEEVFALCRALPRGADCNVFSSIYGHDAFLKETWLVSKTLQAALREGSMPSPFSP